MTTTLPSDLDVKSKNLLGTIAQILGVDFTLLTPGFKFTLIGLEGGDAVFAQLMPKNGVSQVERIIRAGSLISPATEGTLDADIESGTSIMVASTIAIDVTGGVPVGSSVYASVTTPGGKPKLLAAARTSATQITVSSGGSGYGAILDTEGAQATLIASTLTFNLNNVAGDLLAVKEVTTGGTAADHFSVVRVSDTQVKVQAHTAAGALVAGNTSIVKAYVLGALAHETSTVRWAVVRP